MLKIDLLIFETVFINKLSTFNRLRTLKLLRSTKSRTQSYCRLEWDSVWNNSATGGTWTRNWPPRSIIAKHEHKRHVACVEPSHSLNTFQEHHTGCGTRLTTVLLRRLSSIFFFAGRAGCTQAIKRHFVLIYAFILCTVMILDFVNHTWTLPVLSVCEMTCFVSKLEQWFCLRTRLRMALAYKCLNITSKILSKNKYFSVLKLALSRNGPFNHLNELLKWRRRTHL